MTPQNDTTIEIIAQALADALNLRWPGCVAGMSAYDRIPTDPSLYPHLLIHRLEAEGEGLERCRGVARYMMLSQAEKDAMPGQFRAMQLAIVEFLRNYYADPPENHQIPPQEFSCIERIIGFNNGLIPFFEIEFVFHDLEPLCA